MTGGRLDAALGANVAAHRQAFTLAVGALRPGLLQRRLEERGRTLGALGGRLGPLARRAVLQAEEQMRRLAQVHASLDPEGPLRRGFALIRHADGRLARSADALSAGESVHLKFHDGARAAVVDGPSPRTRRQTAPSSGQGDLF